MSERNRKIAEPPFVKRPSSRLKFESLSITIALAEREQPPPPQLQQKQQQQSISSQGSGNFLKVERELDEEIGKRILSFIYRRRNEKGGTVGGIVTKTPVQNNNNNNNNRNHAYGPSGHNETFYIPRNNSISSSNSNNNNRKNALEEGFSNLVDSVTDYCGVKTKSNVQRIDKTYLMQEGITIEMLIVECQVPISEMKFARILNTFQDLVDLGFIPQDLTRGDRTLLNCDTIANLYKREREDGKKESTYNMILRHGVEFDIRHILLGRFRSSELMSIGYNLDEPIRRREINSYQLRALNFTLRDLTILGLEKSHLDRMEITEKLALTKQPDGLGWSRDEYYALLSSEF